VLDTLQGSTRRPVTSAGSDAAESQYWAFPLPLLLVFAVALLTVHQVAAPLTRQGLAIEALWVGALAGLNALGGRYVTQLSGSGC
jgi:hypothetical protein